MSAPTSKLAGYDITVADHGMDAMIVERPGRATMLLLRPGMSFGAAVNSVAALAPFAPDDEVRALVRRHLPDAFDLGLDVIADELADATPQVPDVRANGSVMIAATLATALVLSASLVLASIAGFRAQIEDVRADGAGASAGPTALVSVPPEMRTHVNKIVRQMLAEQRAERRDQRGQTQRRAHQYQRTRQIRG